MHSEFVFTLNSTFNTKSVCETYELWGFYCVVIVVSKDVFAAKKKCFSPWFLELQATTIVTVVFVVKHNRNWKMNRGECLFIGRTLLQLFAFFLTFWKHFLKKNVTTLKPLNVQCFCISTQTLNLQRDSRSEMVYQQSTLVPEHLYKMQFLKCLKVFKCSAVKCRQLYFIMWGINFDRVRTPLLNKELRKIWVQFAVLHCRKLRDKLMVNLGMAWGLAHFMGFIPIFFTLFKQGKIPGFFL